MFTKETLDKARQGFIAMIFGVVLAVVPFYFHTQAMTEEHSEKLVEQSDILEVQEERLKNLEVQGAVDDAEIEQIKESLERIEKKIDRLIERGN